MLPWQEIPENSSGSQYYITLAASERLNGNFTVIGKVIDGWDEIERLEHVEVEEAIEPAVRICLSQTGKNRDDHESQTHKIKNKSFNNGDVLYYNQHVLKNTT